jgi:DNA polymerase I-like protein with 3'-5' exonuclease and polymerase domains
MLVIETIDSQDLKEGRLLHERARTVVSNLIQYSCVQAKREFGFKRKECAFATVNFNSYKFFDQPRETWPGHRRKMAKRVWEIIADKRPTHVIVFGDWAMKAMMPGTDWLEKKRGWVFDVDDGHGHPIKICGSLDLQPLYSTRKEDITKDDEEDAEETGDVFGKANLLFYVSRNVINGLAGRNLYDLSHIKPNPVVVDTIEKFDKLFKRLCTEEVVALDTETRNGSVNHNAIHTMQLAFSEKKGYLLPIDHPETPFSEDERKYIKKKLRKFFGARPGKYALKYLITQYGIFDLRVLRVELGLPLIWHAVWEIMAGEWVLDENIKYLASAPFNTPQGGLDQIFTNYGNDHYKTAAFGKGDRSNPELTKLSNKDFVDYGVMDVQSIFGIHQKQIERASNILIGDKPFTKFFKRLILKQFSNTVHVLSHMKQNGSTVDKDYLKLLISKESPLLDLIKKARSALYTFPQVQKANRLLLAESSGQQSNKGLFNRVQTVFKWNKSPHLKTLFFGVMQLKPVSFSKKTKLPSTDKFFIKAYEEEHEIVKKFGEYQKLTKLYSTYVKGWWKVLSKNIDSLADFKLRPDYGFFTVVTGRLNSMKPSLQQVPAHGEVAKYIKRMFIALEGHLLIKFDYSAHEIRCWSYVSGDEILADAFRIGQKLRQLLFRATDPKKIEEINTALKRKGDMHIYNAFHFFGKWIDKKDPLRDAIKKVVFGVIYGKGVKTLARDIKQSEEIAQEIVDKLYKRFPKAGKWLKWSMNHALDYLYTYSPIGMRRNLFGVMTGINSIVAAMKRRAANSPIQGFASQIGVTTARLIVEHLYEVLMKFGYIDKKTKRMPADITKAVHDALHTESPYDIVLIVTHVVQWVATYGVTAWYKENYGANFLVEPEIEMEFGASEDKMYKWDWTPTQLDKILKDSLQDQNKLGNCKDTDLAYASIMSPYRNKKLKSFLEVNYPILGVSPKKG